MTTYIERSPITNGYRELGQVIGIFPIVGPRGKIDTST